MYISFARVAGAFFFATFLGSVCMAQQTQDLAHAQGTTRAIFNFASRCASCHDSARDGAPSRYALNDRTPEEILAKLTSGSMAEHAKGLTEYELRTMAVYLGGRPLGAAPAGDASMMKNRCSGGPSATKQASWNGWGFDASNSRFQNSPGLTAAQVPKLKLKWAFGFPNGNSAYGQPAIAGGRVYVAADTGYVYALDAATGCVHWSFQARAGVRTAISLGPKLAYFGDVKGMVYALDIAKGTLAWSARTDTHPIARIVGTPKLEGGRLYVPVASLEESAGGNPNYPCCTFRGSIVAYDANTGKQIWKSYMIPEEARPIKKTSVGTQLWGPAGAGVWSTPAIDTKKRVMYVSTGNSYTDPAPATTDAVVAIDLATGKRLWSKQMLADDASVSDCRPTQPAVKSETCPENQGPDMDLAAAPMLKTLPDGRTLLIVGQKNGDVWALDTAKQGAVVWKQLVGRGAENGGGGMMWGTAMDDRLAYFPVTSRANSEPIGLAALKIESGELAWRAGKLVGSAAPATVIPGVLFSGSTNGVMYAFSTTDGGVLWEFDTAKEFETVNGVAAKGGNMSGPGPVVAGGMVYVASGYSDLGGGVRGNVLLAFSAD